MKRLSLIGNWKMNNTVQDALHYLSFCAEKKSLLKEFADQGHTFAIAPSFPLLAYTKSQITDMGLPVQIMAQNIHREESGAYTGDVSLEQIKEFCSGVIIGHSERRQYYKESHADIAHKIKRVLAEKMIPIFCVGETLEERERGEIFSVIEHQLSEGLKDVSLHVGADHTPILYVAYEPVWAIGTGKTASVEQAQEVHAFIRQKLNDQFKDISETYIPLLYGGSVKPDNVLSLLQSPDIQGALVGGASLKADIFISMVNNLKEI